MPQIVSSKSPTTSDGSTGVKVECMVDRDVIDPQN